MMSDEEFFKNSAKAFLFFNKELSKENATLIEKMNKYESCISDLDSRLQNEQVKNRGILANLQRYMKVNFFDKMTFEGAKQHLAPELFSLWVYWKNNSKAIEDIKESN